MRIIDLLNKIANREEVPMIIKYRDEIYYFINHHQDYVTDASENVIDSNTYFIGDMVQMCSLNDEIEIIEEDKPIEKLDYEINENNVDICTEKIRCKINELIDEVNKLKKVEVMSNAKNHC